MAYFIANRNGDYYNVNRTFLPGYKPRSYKIREGAELDAKAIANRYNAPMRVVNEYGEEVVKVEPGK